MAVINVQRAFEIIAGDSGILLGHRNKDGVWEVTGSAPAGEGDACLGGGSCFIFPARNSCVVGGYGSADQRQEMQLNGVFVETNRELGAAGMRAFGPDGREIDITVDPCTIKVEAVGQGHHGSVFALGPTVVAKTKMADDVTTFRQEYNIASAVRGQAHGLGINIPTTYGFFTSVQDFCAYWGITADCCAGIISAPVFCMQRVHGAPGLAINLLAEAHPLQLCSGIPRSVITVPWRLYLGTNTPQPAEQFLETPAILANQATKTGLNLRATSRDMGVLVGRIVFNLGYAPSGVEFVVGRTSASGKAIYAMDFGGFQPHGQNKRMVAGAIYDNDPYYAKASMKYSEEFTKGLLDAGEAASQRGFADAIIEELSNIRTARAKSSFLLLTGTNKEWE